MKTALFVLLIVASISAIFGKSVDVKEQICEPKSTFNDYCNVCLCSDDGLTADCTKKFCFPNMWNSDGTRVPIDDSEDFNHSLASSQICKPGTEFQLFCNDCWCDNFGTGYDCTRALCSEGIWSKNGTVLIDIDE